MKIASKATGQFILFLLVFAAVLFLPAGTFSWVAGWIFFASFFTFLFVTEVWLYRHNPGLLQERLHLGTSDQRQWDRALFPMLNIFFLGWLVFMGFDAGRFHWSLVPVWVQWMGFIILLFSFRLFFLTFRENAYLSPVVRIQQDRGHSVVTTGPYRHVRHPMYSAILIFVIGTALLLGSAYGVLAGMIPCLILARRAVLEERTLREKLPGYGDYMTRTRYRFIPHIW